MPPAEKPPRILTAIRHADGLSRCPWPGVDPQYVAYHDEEWGVPEWDDRALFEKLVLDGFQAGLSWIAILRKRDNFRAAFDGFDPHKIVRYDDAKVHALMQDAGIVRNRAKIAATIANAQAIGERVPEGLDALLWSFAPAAHVRPARLADTPSTSPESVAMAKELKRRGLRFVGPTTAYALMQATGMVDDHMATCWRAAAG
jgi:DNA-3-methyladenine glycosylase I